MIRCKHCPQIYPDFVRTTQNKQRSGYRILQAHIERVHEQYRGAYHQAARIDDLCPMCDGKGCQYCEPEGPKRFNFNTLEPLGE
jgi:hypothetical protein